MSCRLEQGFITKKSLNTIKGQRTRIYKVKQMNLGIDVSKKTLDCCLISDGIFYEKKFANNPEGIKALQTWLQEQETDKEIHCCCEATGNYYQAVAEALKQNHIISVENPYKIKSFAKTIMQRNKTDKQDARLIAEYCKTLKPQPWQQPKEAQKRLQEITRLIARTKKSRAAEKNKAQTAPDYLKRHIQSTIQHFDKLIEELETELKHFYSNNPEQNTKKQRLQTIDGIGESTANELLAVIDDRFKTAKQLTAYLGLDPRQSQSGTSLNKKAHISKMGRSDTRTALYMPAMVAYRMNAFPDFIARLKGKGKPPKVIITAIMRKLAVIAFHIIKKDEDYDKSRYR